MNKARQTLGDRPESTQRGRFYQNRPYSSQSLEEEPGEEVHLIQERAEAKNSVDTNYARNTSQVSEACPFECINTEGIFVVGKVQITLDAWKELTSGKLILDTVQRVSVSFESDLN